MACFCFFFLLKDGYRPHAVHADACARMVVLARMKEGGDLEALDAPITRVVELIRYVEPNTGERTRLLKEMIASSKPVRGSATASAAAAAATLSQSKRASGNVIATPTQKKRSSGDVAPSSSSSKKNSTKKPSKDEGKKGSSSSSGKKEKKKRKKEEDSDGL